MFRYTEVLVAVANALEAEEEPPRSRPHHLDDVFGSRAQIARRESSLARACHGLVEIVKVARGQASPRLLGNRGSICAHRRHIYMGAEFGHFLVGHASTDIAPRDPESCLPAASIEHLGYTAYASVDHEVLASGNVPEQPYDRIVVVETLAQLGIRKPGHDSVFYTRSSGCRCGVDVGVLGQEYLWYRAFHLDLLRFARVRDSTGAGLTVRPRRHALANFTLSSFERRTSAVSGGGERMRASRPLDCHVRRRIDADRHSSI
jgi:hypothetical protein